MSSSARGLCPPCLYYIHIELFLDFYHQGKALEKRVDSDAQHAISRGSVLDSEDGWVR